MRACENDIKERTTNSTLVTKVKERGTVWLKDAEVPHTAMSIVTYKITQEYLDLAAAV